MKSTSYPRCRGADVGSETRPVTVRELSPLARGRHFCYLIDLSAYFLLLENYRTR